MMNFPDFPFVSLTALVLLFLIKYEQSMELLNEYSIYLNLSNYFTFFLLLSAIFIIMCMKNRIVSYYEARHIMKQNLDKEKKALILLYDQTNGKKWTKRLFSVTFKYLNSSCFTYYVIKF